METVNAPAAGWYPDPGGSTSLRWWDGGGWTTHLSTPPQAVPAPAPAPAPAAAPVPAPVVPAAPVAPVVEPAAYAGDPRFGGPSTAPMPTDARPPTPSATPSATAYGPVPGGRPTSHLVVAGVVALVLLVVAVLVGKSVLGGSGSSDSADQSGVTGGLLGPGNPQVAAMKADVLHIATTEETLFTDRQVFVAGASGKGGLVLGGQSIRLSSSGETVQVVLSPSGVGYCIRAARTPAGGGGPQVVLYVSTQGGLQPPQITSCPAAF